MSDLKSLYQGNKEGTTVSKYLKASAPNSLGDGIESGAHLKSLKDKREYFLPPVDYSDPRNFAKFGSAFEYYKNAFEYISGFYPYDGSGLEKTNFFNNVNPLEKYTLDVLYPRSTGHVTFGAEYGTVVSNSSGYFGSTTTQYLQAKGGPHSGTIFSQADGRTSNLEFGGPSGSSVEFFFKKNNLIDAAGFVSASSRRQVILDVTNGQTDSTRTDYGRLTIEIVSGSETQFNVNLLSGTDGFSNVLVPSVADSITISDGVWRNFGFVFNTQYDTPTLDLYVNGKCIETVVPSGPSTQINEVTGTMIANLGALRQSPAGYSGLSQGDGKLSGSIDEFRFWKVGRTSEQIGRYWLSNVDGGADKHDANVGLGVYYKFNEGITLSSSVDQIVLDYSGRLSNGVFTGYNSTYTRSTSSAIDAQNLTSVSEKGDPIIRRQNPEYIASKSRYQLSGSNYDSTNNARLINHLPNWVVEEDENSEGELLNITQILSSYFDTLYNQITALKKLKYTTYNSGTLTNSIDAFPHNDRLIENMGLQVPEFFENAGVLEQFFQRDEQIDFDQQLVDIKNSIYKNIYNNLSYILKSKGNEKAIRNFIRCLGVGEEILALNTYSTNADFELSSSYRTGVSTKKYVDFSGLRNQSDDDAVIYQYYDSSNPNSVGVISEKNDTKQFAITVQGEFVFPSRQNGNLIKEYNIPQTVSSSLYGFHTPRYTSATSTDLAWASPADDKGLQIYAVKSPGAYAEVTSPAPLVKDAFFIVKDTAGKTLLTTDIFRNVYDNQRWSLALTLKPKKYPFSDGITGAKVINSGYELGFCGYNFDTGTKRNEFLVTADLSYNSGSAIITSAKRLYVGAHREDFISGTLTPSDMKAGGLKYWTDYLPPATIEAQTREVDSHGVLHPYRNSHVFQTSSANVYTPNIQTLALLWEFDKVSGSNTSGRFTVEDASSGSIGQGYISNYQGSVFSDINLRQHTARGDFFSGSSPAQKEYVYTETLLPPQYMSTGDMIKVLNSDDELFGTFIKPVNNYYAIEKSMYRSISNRMLHLFASIDDFNNLIGEPVNKFRLNYKKMEKLREIFFRKVQNNIPDLQKYLDYYKWLDTSMGQIIQQLFPVSAEYAPEIRNVIESHSLERNKIKYQYPLIKDARPWGNSVGPLGNLGGSNAPLGVGGDPRNPAAYPDRRPRRPGDNGVIEIPDLGGNDRNNRDPGPQIRQDRDNYPGLGGGQDEDDDLPEIDPRDFDDGFGYG